jgi:hypothetical protein
MYRDRDATAGVGAAAAVVVAAAIIIVSLLYVLQPPGEEGAPVTRQGPAATQPAPPPSQN